jgi:hypothetical protein
MNHHEVIAIGGQRAPGEPKSTIDVVHRRLKGE